MIEIPTATAWANVRYGRLLPLAARSRAFGTTYARVVSLAEWSLDSQRRQAATARIGRWLRLRGLRAGALYRRCLESEAREEADTAWFMTHPYDELARACRGIDRPTSENAATIWLTLHFGAPILAYVYLCRWWGVDARIIGRTLDDGNPMPAAKRDWGRRKVAWVEEITGRPFLGVDAASIARAREHLLHGGSLFAAVDVPGDVVGRSADLDLFGESVRIAAGILRIAELERLPLRWLTAIPRGHEIDVRCGKAIPASPRAQQLAAIGCEMEAILRSHPEEWWLWPYLPSSR